MMLSVLVRPAVVGQKPAAFSHIDRLFVVFEVFFAERAFSGGRYLFYHFLVFSFPGIFDVYESAHDFFLPFPFKYPSTASRCFFIVFSMISVVDVFSACLGKT